MFPRLALFVWLVCTALPLAAQEPWLSVTGSGLARAEQAGTVLQVTVAVRDVNARPATEEAGRMLDRLTRRMRAISQVGAVAAGPVSVTSLREHPPRLGRQGAWMAEGALTVTVADPAAVAEVTERLLAGGALTVEAVVPMEAPAPEALSRVALERAVDDARRKADGMAAAAGVRLGPVLELSGQDVRALGPEDGAAYVAGTVTLRATATVVFAVGP